jgi:hypothetical protein
LLIQGQCFWLSRLGRTARGLGSSRKSQGLFLARALCLLIGRSFFILLFPHFWRGIEQPAAPEMLTALLIKGGLSPTVSGAFSLSVP